jgi:hypothetical protein
VAREAAARENAEIQALVDSVLAEDPEEQAEDEEVMKILAATTPAHEAVTEKRPTQNTFADMEDWLSKNNGDVLKALLFFCFCLFFVGVWVHQDFSTAIVLFIFSVLVWIPSAYVFLLVGKLVCRAAARRM